VGGEKGGWGEGKRGEGGGQRGGGGVRPRLGGGGEAVSKDEKRGEGMGRG